MVSSAQTLKQESNQPVLNSGEILSIANPANGNTSEQSVENQQRHSINTINNSNLHSIFGFNSNSDSTRNTKAEIPKMASGITTNKTSGGQSETLDSIKRKSDLYELWYNDGEKEKNDWVEIWNNKNFKRFVQQQL